jgi:hypothetical protein
MGDLMRGWRTKIIFVLVVYFAGFATAIYTLAPAPENRAGNPGGKGILSSSINSDELVQSLNSGMHKAIEAGKDAAWRTAKFLKEKINARQSESIG